jgi:GGDEF domain-containing protein
MHHPPPRPRRARPVADAPVEELLARGEDLAKGWLLALLERRPLEDAAAVAGSAIAVEGPRICTAVLSALRSDDDLARLERGGMLEGLVAGAGAFAGGGGVEAVLGAVEALHGVLWSALRAELSDPDPELVYALAERLAAVTELVRAAALRAPFAGETPPGLSAVPSAQAQAEPEASQASSPASSSGRSGEALWVAALEDEIMRSRRSGAPLSLLLAELEDSERLVAAERPDRPPAFGRFAQALRGVMRRQDLLASEDAARAWVIARDTARPGATALADRVASAVGALEPVHGAPLKVSVGVAVLDEDAHDAASLLDAAEEACFAAAASGAGVVRDP